MDGVLYVSQDGGQWRCLPTEFGPWTRVWSQFRRWSRNGTWPRLLAALRRLVRAKAGRTEATPSMVVIDTHLARGASNGGRTFHDRGGPDGMTNGAKADPRRGRASRACRSLPVAAWGGACGWRVMAVTQAHQ